MFRESLDVAKKKFSEAVGSKRLRGSVEEVETVTKLVQDTLASYGDVGIFDPAKLAEIDFINQPDLLVQLVSGSRHRKSRALKPDMQLLTDVTTNWMQMMVDKKYPPLTPHHTQAFTVLMMCKFFSLHLDGAELATADGSKKKKPKYRTFIAQLATGEGKSIVIAMLAIFMVKLHGVKIHVLENNAGLLQRDFAQNKPFYDRYDIKSSTDLTDPDAQIVYCLKDAINRRFLRSMVAGTLDELSNTVLVVDEVDDLIVNERPTAHYVKRDEKETPALRKCYEALVQGGGTGDDLPMPEGVEEHIWQRARNDAAYAATREENKHYRIVENSDGKKDVLQLDAQGNVPKVRLSSPWLTFLAFKLAGIPPNAETRWSCVCTPYVFNKYKGIFGLTGSVGGKAELKYLASTYKALKFDVPRFLDTCVGNARKEVLNRGVELFSGEAEQIKRVCALAAEYFREVPVLIITTGGEQIGKVIAALKGSSSESGIPAEEVQRLSQFDENGRSLDKQWQGVIEDATRRLGGSADSRCRVTVTDKFGGRGHDFQVVDKESNANGGMLVIATSIPDEREWIQWKGRTARQDRPGQFYVILDESAAPFSNPKHKKLASKLKALAAATPSKKAQDDPDAPKPQDAMVEALLDVADDGIGAKIKEFEAEQARGEKLNEITELYYKEHPRSFDDPWPQDKYLETDAKLRDILTNWVEASPKEVKAIAKSLLQIELE